jgi:hypothetical protein
MRHTNAKTEMRATVKFNKIERGSGNEQKIILSLVVSICLSVTFVACGDHDSKSEPIATDYSLAEHWLSLPAPIKEVDVFYFYPTAWQSADQINPHICAINDPSMLEEAPAAFDRQATAFETVGNIFAPYYRQDNLSPINREEVIAGIPTLDAVAAFDYYIQHFNNNRPFILAGHSQGSNVLSNLLAEYMADNPDVYSRMIAAYVIGYSVTPAYLADNPHLKFATGPDDTGVIISYNTEAPTVDGTNPVLSTDGIGLAINPITWTTDEDHADGDGGSILVNPANGYAERVDGVPVPMLPSADAQVSIAKGVVICSNVDVNIFSPGPPPSSAFPKGVYHSFDYPFYYYNIRENAANRVDKYLHP